MNTGLAGKIAFVTGAANGIGRATAVAFAKEGVALALLDIDEAGLRGLAGELGDVPMRYAVADLSDAQSMQDGIGQLLSHYGGTADILVNNVGSGSIRTFDQLTDDDWDRTFQLNFMSYVRATRQLLPALRESGGAIVNNASDLARQPEPVPSDYSALKAAVLALTKSLARAEGPRVRVNAVSPGPIWTPFWTKPGGFAETLGQHHGMEPQAAVEHEMKRRELPLQRLGTAQEVANVIVFLASGLASFVTSSVWGVDGGSVRGI
ncbi:SDR family NAD(P)-dependent oxidoreductase [Sphingomonas sp. Leaf25]|uniref:SDR family NAD(P)-dependent oxidoreductase n=1 Tax=Sphingomonas sp. Leaf25 TaxID=1735692 RepID=UPI000701D2FE|nr:SDR family oxidoreductase [Sphingomonas sp. Leaf25]KQM99391.1 short-chain dehydrogenase [Sphingomonas sp. Leaf25]